MACRCVQHAHQVCCCTAAEHCAAAAGSKAAVAWRRPAAAAAACRLHQAVGYWPRQTDVCGYYRCALPDGNAGCAVARRQRRSLADWQEAARKYCGHQLSGCGSLVQRSMCSAAVLAADAAAAQPGPTVFGVRVVYSKHAGPGMVRQLLCRDGSIAARQPASSSAVGSMAAAQPAGAAGALHGSR